MTQDFKAKGKLEEKETNKQSKWYAWVILFILKLSWLYVKFWSYN